jgi:8-oxo-dGTP diphosphatase
VARFNIRIYGVCINDRNEVLVSNEQHRDLSFTKFPGGGLEWGEGTKDCLKREFQEEFGLEIEVGELFYLTDFFQLSAFSDTDQVISVYYHIQLNEVINPEMFLGDKNEQLQWIPFSELSENLFMFPIDKIVASRLKTVGE